MTYKDRQEIPADYPQGMNDKQIEEAIKKYFNEIIQSEAQENTMIQCYPLISLGQHELEKRQAKRLNCLTMGVSIVSIVIAVIALCIAIQNASSSERWKQTQINSLATLQTKLDLINSSIRELVTVTQKCYPTPPVPAPISPKSQENVPNKQLTSPSSGRVVMPGR